MSSTQQERELSRRLDKIESQNRIFKVYAGFITLLFMAVLFMGNTAVLQNGRFKNITAQGLTIVDSGGEKLIFIGKAADGTGLEVFNKNNKRVFGLGINKDESGSGFFIADNKGMPRIGCGLEEDVPSFAIANMDGKKIIGLGGGETGYGISIMDKNEVERVGLGFKDGNSGFAIFDNKGEYVRGMIRQKDGIHYSSYVDESGKEIINR